MSGIKAGNTARLAHPLAKDHARPEDNGLNLSGRGMTNLCNIWISALGIFAMRSLFSISEPYNAAIKIRLDRIV